MVLVEFTLFLKEGFYSLLRHKGIFNLHEIMELNKEEYKYGFGFEYEKVGDKINITELFDINKQDKDIDWCVPFKFRFIIENENEYLNDLIKKEFKNIYRMYNINSFLLSGFYFWFKVGKKETEHIWSNCRIMGKNINRTIMVDNYLLLRTDLKDKFLPLE